MTDHMTREQRSHAMKQVKLRNGSLEQIVQGELESARIAIQMPRSFTSWLPRHCFSEESASDFCGWRLLARLATTSLGAYTVGFCGARSCGANRIRDRRNFRRLRMKGWTVIRIWGHELKRPRRRNYLRRIQHVLRRAAISNQ